MKFLKINPNRKNCSLSTNSMLLLKLIVNFMRKNSLFIILPVFFILLGCGEKENTAEMTKGHVQAIKEQCKNDPDKKLCGKEARLKFKKDGHEFVNFKGLEKDQINRVVLNCKPERQYGLVPYNQCLFNQKQLALGNELTKSEDNKRVTSNVEKIKQYVYYVAAFNEGNEDKGASGTGVAISKNYIATNCHVVLDYEYSKQKQKAIYYDTIFVRNLLDEDKQGVVSLFKKGYEKDLDICILKTKTDLKYIKEKIPYKRLKQRMKVMAMGNPQGIIGHTSDGKITALETWDTDIVHPLINRNPIQVQFPWKIIHHDSAIGQGSSGGPLFDAGGNLIGINTLALTEGVTGGFGIALSADHLKDVLRD